MRPTAEELASWKEEYANPATKRQRLKDLSVLIMSEEGLLWIESARKIAGIDLNKLRRLAIHGHA